VSPSDPCVEIHNLTFRYDGETNPTLKNLSLKVNRGELVLLCGPTGSGKTTLALSLNGLVPYTTGGDLTGSIEVCGLNPESYPTPTMATKIGLVFQDPEGQLCTLFLEDEIAFGPENLMIAPDELLKRVNELLDLIELGSMRLESVFELSGGQKQKVNIASVLAMQPELLVFDMPTANLDPVGSAEVFKVIRRLVTEREITCIVIENRLDDLVPLADRVVVLDMDGGIAFDGSPQEVFMNAEDIMGTLGVEIPQVIEVEMELKKRYETASEDKSISLTIEQEIKRMETLLKKHQISVLSGKNGNKPDKVSGDEKPIVVVDDVHFSYRKGAEVLKGISFAMKKGELLAIVGNNGSGKTTMAKQLVGLLHPTHGRVEVCGMDVSKANISDIASKAAYVFQYPEHQFVAQGSAVYDEIAFNMRMAGYQDIVIKERVDKLIDLFRLNGKEQVSPFELSGGEMRTLSVACMLSMEPELLILDEPTYGQDRRRIKGLMQRLGELRQDGTSVIMISHDMRLVAEYATSVALFHQGKLLFFGDPHELFYKPDLLKLAALKEPPVCTMVDLLATRGIPLQRNIITVPELFNAID
jgi:energy-coupling factor transporter ATP-binding protein EcfA2